MKLKKSITGMLIIMIISLLVGCTNNNKITKGDKKVLNQLLSKDYKCDNVKLEENKRRSDIVSKSKPIEIKWEQTKLSIANYWFDSDIDLKSRKSYIEDTVGILSEINKRYSVDKIYDIYISDKIISHNEDKNIYVKFSDDKFDSSDFIIQSLYSIFGDTSNYGLLYGEMVDIQKSVDIEAKLYLEYDKDYIEKEIIKKPEMLDLTLPVFSKSYFSLKDIDYMKFISVDFVRYIKEKYSTNEFIKLLKSSSEFNMDFDSKFTEYMNNYLKYKKLGVSKKRDTIMYRYKMFDDVDFPICVCTEWMNYCFDPEFKYLYPFTKISYETMGESGYQKIKEIIEHWDKCMADVREYLKNGISVSKKDTKDIVTYISNKCYKKYNSSGYYNSIDDIIYCQDIVPYVHEYTHYITTFDKDMSWWYIEKNIEGIADFCSYKFEDKNVNFTYKQYDKDYYKLRLKLNIKKQFDSYLKSIGENNQNNVFSNTDRQLDFIEMFWCKSILKPDTSDIENNSEYNKYIYGCAFVRYLVDKYGIDKYMQYFNTYSKNDFYSVYGKNLVRMNDDFIDYLKNKYGSFIK